MKIIYLLVILNSNVSTPQVFGSDVACQQAAAFIINNGGEAKCIVDTRDEEN